MGFLRSGPVRVELIEHEEVRPGYWRSAWRSPEIARVAEPGQFLMVGVGEQVEHHLGRPLSVYDVDPDTGAVSVLYRITGAGTSWLGAQRIGSWNDILGPLGNTYPLPLQADDPILIVGGGIGLASLYYFARVASVLGRPVRLFLGARSEADYAGLEDFERLAAESNLPLEVRSDDGSAGPAGRVTEPLVAYLQEGGKGQIFACGPKPMLREVQRIAAEYKHNAYLAMEAPMACGYGVCMGCAIPVRQVNGRGGIDGSNGPEENLIYQRCCVEGPIFPAEGVIL